MTENTYFPESLPDKKYFRIGEVGTIVGVDTHVLRYWEKEFKIIKPFRGKSKQRLYRQQDVYNLLKIKQLLHHEGYTISGARKILKNKSAKGHFQQQCLTVSHVELDEKQKLGFIKKELSSILLQLNKTGKVD